MSAAAVNAYANRLAWEEAGTVWDSASHCSTVWPLRPYGLGKAVLLLALAPEVEGWRPRTANMSIKRYQTYPEYLEELRGTWEHFPCASLATCGGSVSSWFKLSSSASGGLWSDESTMQLNSLCDMVLAWCMCQTCASKDKQQTESAKTGSLLDVPWELSQLSCHNWRPPLAIWPPLPGRHRKFCPKWSNTWCWKCFGSVWLTANPSHT